MNLLRNQAGFTLVELLTAAIIIGLLATLVSGFYSDRLVDFARTQSLIILQSNTKQALESMQRDIEQAQSIEAANEWADSHGPGGNQYGWASSSASPSVVVLAEPTEDTSGNLQYVDGAHTVLATNDVIYYVNGGALYRRVIVNPICASAGGSVSCSARTTCPAASATSSCPADGKVIENVANLVATYYDTNDNILSTPSNAYSLSVTMTQSLTEFGHTYSNSLSSRITLRNKA